MKKPTVSVVMPTFNREKYIAESIKSVLLSTLKELELIIVDDGSTDGAVEIIKQFAEKDPRVIYVNNIKHKGVVGASNLGTRMAKGKYIARMDDDDISLPERFQKEVAFLEKHPDIMACGCWVETMPDKGKGTIWQLPTDPAEIKSMMLFCGAIANPTCLIRRSVFFDLGFWFTTYKGIQIAEDYDFWTRLGEKHKIANIPEVLFRYRWHQTNASTSDNSAQALRVKHIMLRQLKKLGLTPNAEEIGLHQKIGKSEIMPGRKAPEMINRWADKLIAANKKTCVYPEPAFTKIVNKKKEEALELHRKFREKFKYFVIIIAFIAFAGKVLRIFFSGRIVDRWYQIFLKIIKKTPLKNKFT